MKRLIGLTALALLIAGGASAQTLRIGLQEDPDVLDPHRARTFVGRLVFTAMCDRLVDLDAHLQPVPQLATSWSWNADSTVLTFELRPGVKFQDGEPLDAAAVKTSLDRARTLPDSLRKSELGSISSVEVLGPTTVALKLAKPDATLLSQLTDRAGMILSPKALAGDFGQHPVCAGPYEFAERVQNDRIVLKKFPGYWNADAYHFDRVVFLPIPDSTVRLANLRAGDLDMLERLAPSDVKAVKADPKLAFLPVTGLGYQGITFNIGNGDRGKKGPFADKRVRQALQYAIDRDAMNEVVGEGIFPPAQQAVPLASPYLSKKFPPTGRDIDKAKALLKEAGVKTPVEFELSFGTSTTAKQTNELIQAMIEEAGFKVNLRPTEFAALQKEAAQGNFDAVQYGWSGRSDPDGNIYTFYACKGALNDGRYCNPDLDRLMEEARSTVDEKKRADLYDRVEEIVQDDLPIVYLYYQPWPFVTSKKVVGFTPIADGMIRLAGVRFAN
jgi:peptide/nickel transport system substrate-binding protein